MLTPPLPFAGCGDILGAEPLGVLAVHARHLLLGQRSVRGIISQEVFITSFCESHFPHKSVTFFLILVIVKNKLTDFWGGDF